MLLEKSKTSIKYLIQNLKKTTALYLHEKETNIVLTTATNTSACFSEPFKFLKYFLQGYLYIAYI